MKTATNDSTSNSNDNFESSSSTLIQLLSLSEVLQSSIIAKDFRVNSSLCNSIHLTSHGSKVAGKIKNSCPSISDAELRLALLAEMYGDELLVDESKTKVSDVKNYVDGLVRHNTARIPWKFDRLLYDKFFESFPPGLDDLDNIQTLKLLDNTPQGVIQVGTNLIGPFGILKSGASRIFDGPSKLRLWHCTDHACSNFHTVSFTPADCPLNFARFVISELYPDRKSFKSDLFKDIRLEAYGSSFLNDLSVQDFPVFLANIFSESELSRLLQFMLEEYGKELRERFPTAKADVQRLSGPASSIAKKLNKVECFQLLLLIDDYRLINGLEKLIQSQEITIPPTEIRVEPEDLQLNGDNLIQCSRFGIRTLPKNFGGSLERLKRLIRQIYDRCDSSRQLSWKLRYVRGSTLNEQLDHYVCEADLKVALSDLIFESHQMLTATFESLKFGNFSIPTTQEEEQFVLSQILWKLGFDLLDYPDLSFKIATRESGLREALRSNIPSNEEQRDRIRSAGVNLFVSLEGILEFSLAVIAWGLFSDHIGSTHFVFDLNTARKVLVSVLRNTQSEIEEPIVFDESGKHTLYALVHGYSLLAQACEQAIAAPETLIKQKTEIPSFVSNTDLFSFPFLYKVLFLDLRGDEQSQIIKVLRETTRILDAGYVCSVRNRIDHNRDDFPTAKEIEVALMSINKALENLDSLGLLPKVYLTSKLDFDEYKRGRCIFREANGSEISVFLTHQFRLCGLPDIEVPQLIWKAIHFGDSFEPVRFEFREPSEFQRAWAGYPRRLPKTEETD